MNISKSRLFLAAYLSIFLNFGPNISWAQNELSLEQAVSRAVIDDEWIIANELIELSLSQESISAGQLPDPRMSVGLSNMPLDTFNLNQEPMTQLRIGINQTFPRGDTLALQQRQKMQQSEINPYLRDNRKANIAVQVSILWLNTFLAQQSIELIQNDRELFEQLVDLTGVRYTSAAGLARQQDLVRSELELTRLDDRLAMLRQLQNTNKQKLSQWLPYQLLGKSLSSVTPDIEPPTTRLTSLGQATDFFANHPTVRAHDKRIQIAQTKVSLTQQSLKPAYSVGASYGYRDNAPMGRQRADFISLDLSFDIPYFTEKRQKPKIRASRYTASARQTERILLFKELFSNYQQANAQLDVLDERKILFEDVLLDQMNDLTETTLSAYTADEGDFEEVMRAYIGELNAKIELLEIDVERQKVISRLNYLTATSEN
ncbi:MAG TPA: transporter [Gammaproteobacteria bacterium]|mgnify:CR=1 FL=1|nr:transporter [Gammaproteobacteria bacterium]|tara:strand:+ start:1442 stop:2734 length:1293 start_codon:yes stop_codon:yes gene_type:complete